MKKVSIVIPTRNEQDNIYNMVNVVKNIFLTQLTEYCYEIIITDNKSTDNTRAIIRDICKLDSNVKAIFNLNSFSYSAINAIVQSSGDCALLLVADFQDPPELIPQFVRKWEEGYDAVVGIKKASKENPIMFRIRKSYYSFMNKMSDVELLENFSTFALYDRKIIDALALVNEPLIYLRGIIVEFTSNIAKIDYTRNERVKGKSSNNFFRLYDFAMRGITSYAKGPLRAATFVGAFGALLSIVVGIFYLVQKLMHWNLYNAGIIPIIILMVLFNSFQLMMLGLIGEYIMSINIRVMNHPKVIEEERINFDR